MTETTTSTAVRLRTGVRSRTLDGRGVAVSAGGSAVIIDGAGAAALWEAVEPVLRDGIDADQLLAAVPVGGRQVVQGILDELTRHQLLRDVEADDEPAGGVVTYFEAVTRRPVAAARHVAATALRVRGSGRVATSAVEHLGSAGFVDVALVPDGAGEPAGDGTRIERLDADGTWRPVAFAVRHGVLSLVGPRNRDATPELEQAARRRLATDDPALDVPVHDALVGAQLALAALASSARAAEGTEGATWPEYLVTTSGLVSEPHVQISLPALAAVGPESVSSTEDAPTDPAAISVLEPLWDAVLGVVAEPVPLDLPQLPVGLAALVDAEGRTRGGIGTTTASARLDAVLSELRTVAGDPTVGALGLGVTAEQARVEAVLRLVDATLDDWVAVGDEPASSSPAARRMHAALTLRLGQEARVVVSASPVGLFRVDVGAPDELLGRAYAPSISAATEGALLRALGRVQWRRSTSVLADADPELDVLDTRSVHVTAGVAAWSTTPPTGAAAPVRFSDPFGAPRWAAAGTAAVVATWR